MFPGWHVTVDGEPAEPIPVNGLFRGVWAPAGDHSIVWRYDPASFRWGATISILGLGVTLLLLFWRRTAR